MESLFDIPAVLGGSPDVEWGGGLTWDGTGFWTRIGDQFCKLDMSGQTVACFDFVRAGADVYGCIEWDGSRLWVAAGDSIYQLEPATGATIAAIQTPIQYGGTNELVWDGSSLWVYGGASPLVPSWYHIDTLGVPSDTVVDPLVNRGGAWDGQSLCCMTHPSRVVPHVYYSDFYRLTPEGETIDVRRISDVILYQLAYDGRDFFTISETDGGSLQLCKLIL